MQNFPNYKGIFIIIHYIYTLYKIFESNKSLCYSICHLSHRSLRKKQTIAEHSESNQNTDHHCGNYIAYQVTLMTVILLLQIVLKAIPKIFAGEEALITRNKKILAIALELSAPVARFNLVLLLIMSAMKFRI